MKSILLSAGLLLCVLSSQAQTELLRYKAPKQIGSDKDVWDVTNNKGFWIHYEQPKEVMAVFEKEAALKMWSAEQKSSEQAKLPSGGWLTARLVGSLTGADPHNLTFIIQDASGNEVQRHQPASAVPNVVSLQYGVYSSEIAVPLQSPLTEGSKVFVVNEVKKIRHEFLIRPL